MQEKMITYSLHYFAASAGALAASAAGAGDSAAGGVSAGGVAGFSPQAVKDKASKAAIREKCFIIIFLQKIKFNLQSKSYRLPQR